MQAFARWAGNVAATAAAVLAVVWLLEAMPESDPPWTPDSAACFRAQTDRLLAEVNRDRAGLTMAEARLRYCPPPPRKTWDSDKATRGLIAAAVAVGLLLMAAMVGRRPQG
jgi:hypothetical protein